LVEVEPEHAGGWLADREGGRVAEPRMDVPELVGHARQYVPNRPQTRSASPRRRRARSGLRSTSAFASTSSRNTPGTAVGNGPGASSLQTSSSVARAAAGAVRESVTTTTGAPASAK